MSEIETPTDPDRAARGTPTGEVDGVPVYGWGGAPAYLRTVTQLGEKRLKLADGQQPLAYVDSRKFGRLSLYDPAAAVKMKPLTGKQKLAREARRTCKKCGKVREYVVVGDCQVCRDKASAERQRELRRTCFRCSTVRKTPYTNASGPQWCQPCKRTHAREQAEAAARAMLRAVSCRGGCGQQLATEEEVAAWNSANPYRYWEARTCEPCTERLERERAERELAEQKRAEDARQARREEVRALVAWAAEALADPTVAILDTETTGLESDSCIVELAVITTGGDILVDTLLDPGVPIPYEASSIHGIDSSTVEGQPAFKDVLVKLTGALMNRRVLIYNRSYDVARLRWELTRHYRAEGHPDPEASAAAWLNCMTFEDVMIPYSDFVGDWSDYWGNNRWQPLDGGHRAAGDCRAVIGVLGEMSRGHGLVPAPGGEFDHDAERVTA